MSSEPQIRELPEQQAVIERASTDRAGIGELFDSGFGRLLTGLGELGVAPAGAPYARYLETGDRLSVELGVPVATAGARLAGLEAGALPGGRAAVLRHVGPYERLPQAVERLFAWVREHDERPAGPFWECYLTNPAEEPDPAKRVTEVYVPLR